VRVEAFGIGDCGISAPNCLLPTKHCREGGHRIGNVIKCTVTALPGPQ
jgi:hypothetical protein